MAKFLIIFLILSSSSKANDLSTFTSSLLTSLLMYKPKPYYYGVKKEDLDEKEYKNINVTYDYDKARECRIIGNILDIELAYEKHRIFYDKSKCDDMKKIRIIVNNMGGDLALLSNSGRKCHIESYKAVAYKCESNNK